MYIPDAFFSSELFWSCLKWLMIFGVWGVFAFGTWRENRKIQAILQRAGDKKQLPAEKETALLLQTLHRRDMQIWAQLSLLLIVVAANDIHYDAMLLPQDFFSPHPIAAPAPAPLRQPGEDKYDLVLKKSAAAGLPFSDITEFNESNSKQEAYIDWLKDHYESLLVTYAYLDKCKAAGAGDFAIIDGALKKELEAAHAGAKVESNILLAANGSYKEMYSDIPCDSAHISSTKPLYDANMQQIRSTPSRTTVNSGSAPVSKDSGGR